MKQELYCQHCHLATPEQNPKCVHCKHPHTIYKKPTPKDVIAYNQWLQKEIAR